MSCCWQEKKQKEQQKAQKKAAASQSKRKDASAKLSPSTSALVLEELVVKSESLVPPFVTLCVAFIEQEGLTAEGIYRVNGNRAQVDLLMDKFREG